MSAPFPQEDAERDERLSALIGEFFDRRAAGEHLTPEDFASRYPDLADELRAHLAGLPLIDNACSAAAESTAGLPSESPTELPPIAGYELIEEIGRGGMGVVYKALQVTTKRHVALKIMLAGPFASASTRRRFDREVELAARLQHPDIVRVLESGEVAGQRYYAMDYVAGVRLDRHVAGRPNDVGATVKLFAQLCDAVHFAHEHGVVHRDLKPANVLIDDENQPHILDFGLAKATDQDGSERTVTTQVSADGQVLGTLFYLSPEHAAGTPGEVDSRTDVYTLGVMLYEAVTGALPYDTSGRASQVIQRIIENPPVSPSSLSNKVDTDLATILLKALEKDKDRRYQTAAEMADDLRRYQAGEPIMAHRPSSLYVLRKKLHKHRWSAGVVVVATVVALAALMIESSARRREWAQARLSVLQAQRSLDNGAVERVLGDARALYERHRDLPEASLLWAQAQYYSEEMRDGLIHFVEQRARRQPAPWAFQLLLADVYEQASDSERAEQLRTLAEHDAPDSAEAWYLRSYATLQRDRAAVCLDQAVRRDPAHTLAWTRLAHLRAALGDLDGAAQAADRLIELGENRTAWTGFNAHVLVQQGRVDEAIALYTECGDFLHRAHAYRRLGQYDKAEADYTRVLRGLSDDSAGLWVRYQRATPRWILGEREAAVQDYEQVRLLWGRPLYADVRRFFILHELERHEEADALARACKDELQPCWLHRILRCLVGEITPAELVASPLAQSSREYLCEAYYYAGEMCLLLKRPDEARRWFEQCVQTELKFDPDTALATPMNEHELAQWRLSTLFANQPKSP